MTLTRPALRFRTPVPGDGVKIWELVRDAGTLDLNSRYSYLLLCTHFSDTMVVAETGDRCCGFVSAFVPPRQPDTVFVWQIGVDPCTRGRGTGRRLLEELVELPACRGVTTLETTVTPDNAASDALFRSFARQRGAQVDVKSALYPRCLFGGSDHEDEDLYRIAPLRGLAAPRSLSTNALRSGRSTTR